MNILAPEVIIFYGLLAGTLSAMLAMAYQAFHIVKGNAK